MTEFVIRPDANDIRINTQSGVVVSDNTASVVVNCPGEEVTIRPGQSATVVIRDQGYTRSAQQTLYIQQSDPSAGHSPSTLPFLWIETDGDGCPVTFWVDANP